ncbi:MAG: aldose 1-epimerase family protein [Methylocella sp.]
MALFMLVRCEIAHTMVAMGLYSVAFSGVLPLAADLVAEATSATSCAVGEVAMASAKPRDLMDSIELICGAARATIALRGAELLQWSIGGAPLLWESDPAVWAETAPILFPIVGWTNGGEVRVAGEAYPLGLHGFARGMDFCAQSLASDRARLTLASNEATLARYPFSFWLCLTYALSERGLATTLTVENRGAGPMPYACGLHPGFRWPFAGGARGDYAIIFAAEEDPLVPEISKQGLFLESRRKTPLVGRKLSLDPELFAHEALCFLNARSRSLRFERKDGAALLIETSNFSHFALWSRPDAPFLAVESWTGYGDPQDFCGDLFAKPSMRVLEPGAVAHHVALYTHSAA